MTVLLRAWADGDAAAFEQLVPLVHRELHKLARQFMAAEGAGHSLQPTALLNEAYLRLIGGAQVEWRDLAMPVRSSSWCRSCTASCTGSRGTVWPPSAPDTACSRRR